MNIFRVIFRVATLSLLLLLLSSCGQRMSEVTTDTTEALPAEMLCTVTVTDAGGAPIANVMVRVYQNDEEYRKQAVNEEGKALFHLTVGEEYRITLDSLSNKSYFYDETVCHLNAQQTEIKVVLYDRATETMDVFAYGSDSSEPSVHKAYLVGEGAFYTRLIEARTYYVFTPVRPGIYRFSVESKGEVAIGDYGIPMYPLMNSKASQDEDDTFDIEVKEINIGLTAEETTRYLIGLSAEKGTEEAILRIERVGNPVKTPVDEPWVDVLADKELVPYERKRGALKNVDIFDQDLKVVFNENDGYYHLNTAKGPLILLRITEDSPYLASFTTMCDTSRLGAYLYDEKGSFLRKESFNTLVAQYAAVVDPDDGVYPLDAKLAYMLKTVGEAKQWWDFESAGHLNFGTDRQVPVDIAWLFACCYVG